MAFANQSQNVGAVQVTHVYACGHQNTRSAQASDTRTRTFSETACDTPECQAIPMGELLADRGFPEVLRAQYTSRANEKIRAATNVCNTTLNRLGECSPMLFKEMEDAAMGDLDMVNVMQNAGFGVTSEVLDAYLGVMPLVKLMNTFQGLCAVQAPIHHIGTVVDMIDTAIGEMECLKRDLVEAAHEVRSAVVMDPLCQAKFSSYVRSFNKNYGVHDLKLLRSTPQGQYILGLPMTKQNILAAHSFCVERAPSYAEMERQTATAREAVE